MILDIRTRDFESTGAIKSHAERRLRFALGRFARQIRRIRIRLSDLNGPRGGADKSCVIDVTLNRHRPVVIEDVDMDLYVAIDRAADRAARVVSRLIKRRRDLVWRSV